MTHCFVSNGGNTFHGRSTYDHLVCASALTLQRPARSPTLLDSPIRSRLLAGETTTPQVDSGDGAGRREDESGTTDQAVRPPTENAGDQSGKAPLEVTLSIFHLVL